MKECDCVSWTIKVKPDLEAILSDWDSSHPSMPMYFGVKMDFCPFCGKLLQETGWDERIWGDIPDNDTSNSESQPKDSAENYPCCNCNEWKDFTTGWCPIHKSINSHM